MMVMVGERVRMERAEEELERRSRYLDSLIQQQRIRNKSSVIKAVTGKGRQGKAPAEEKEKRDEEAVEEEVVWQLPKKLQLQREGKKEDGHGGHGGDIGQRNVRIRASDMSPELQKRAFRCAQEVLAGMPRLDSKRLALMLKKEFDSSYGAAWHCVVGTSFGSYVTHSLGGFLYFSIDKVYILLFRTAVEPLEQ